MRPDEHGVKIIAKWIAIEVASPVQDVGKLSDIEPNMYGSFLAQIDVRMEIKKPRLSMMPGKSGPIFF